MSELASRFFLQQVSVEGRTPVGDPLELGLRFGEQLVGAQPDLPVCLLMPGVAPMHATLWVQEDAVFITDLGADGGTSVNSEQLEEGRPTALAEGDVLVFGDNARFVLRAVTEQPERTGSGSAQVIELDLGAAEADAAILSAAAGDARAARHLAYCLAAFGARATEADDEYSLLDALMDTLEEMVEAERYFVLVGGVLDQLRPRAVRFRRDDLEEADESRQLPSSTLLAKTLESSEPVVCFDAQVDEGLKDRDSVMMTGVRSALATRLQAAGRTLGVLYIDSRASAGLFEASHGAVLQAIGQMASLGMLYFASRAALGDVVARGQAQVRASLGLAEDLANKALDCVAEVDAALQAGLVADEPTAERLARAVAEIRSTCEPVLMPEPGSTLTGVGPKRT